LSFPKEKTGIGFLIWLGALCFFYGGIGHVLLNGTHIVIDTPTRILVVGLGSALLSIGIILQYKVISPNPEPMWSVSRIVKRIIIVTILIFSIITFPGIALATLAPPPPPPKQIPLTLAWTPQGPGAVDVRLENEILVLTVDLNGSQRKDDYAELFLDLTKVELPNLEQNADGTYNLASWKLGGHVRSQFDFRGNLNHTNGVQFFIFVKPWESFEAQWINAGPGMNSSGMDIFGEINDKEILKEVAGISVKFGIGKDSSASYGGELYLEKVFLYSDVGDIWPYQIAFIASFPIAAVVAIVFLWITKDQNEPKPKEEAAQKSHMKRKQRQD
jgi:hypothetical protein